MLSKTGPTNSRVYTVGVFFRNKKLAEGVGSTLHSAEMEAAKHGLEAIRPLLGDSDPDYVSLLYNLLYSIQSRVAPARRSRSVCPHLPSKVLSPP